MGEPTTGHEEPAKRAAQQKPEKQPEADPAFQGPEAASSALLAAVRGADRGVRARVVKSIQRTAGNAAASKGIVLQRHPEGAGLQSVSPRDLTAVGADPSAAEGAAGAAAPEAASAGPGAPAAPQAPPVPAPEPAPATGPEAAEGAEGLPEASEATRTYPAAMGTAPAGAMSLARAQEVLQDSFGTVHRIVPGSITILADRAATWTKYDEINRGRNNRYANRAWQDGDAQQYLPGLDGFADREGGMVYVNGGTTLTSATAHEMLHMNAHAEYRGTVGETINEGSTEHLALKALAAAGVAMSTGQAYPDEVAIVRRLIEIVGESVLTRAYFEGPTLLVEAYERFFPSTLWAKLKSAAEAKDETKLGPLLTPPTTASRIAVITGIIDEWWVSDMDIAVIEGIYQMASEADQRAIRTAIQPRLIDLTSIGQRTRLRVLFSRP